MSESICINLLTDCENADIAQVQETSEGNMWSRISGGSSYEYIHPSSMIDGEILNDIKPGTVVADIGGCTNRFLPSELEDRNAELVLIDCDCRLLEAAQAPWKVLMDLQSVPSGIDTSRKASVLRSLELVRRAISPQRIQEYLHVLLHLLSTSNISVIVMSRVLPYLDQAAQKNFSISVWRFFQIKEKSISLRGVAIIYLAQERYGRKKSSGLHRHYYRLSEGMI